MGKLLTIFGYKYSMRNIKTQFDKLKCKQWLYFFNSIQKRLKNDNT